MTDIDHARKLKTAQQKLAEFKARGLSVRRWAKENGFSPALTYRVLSGGNPQRGESHNIAVALGIKDGRFGNDDAYHELTEHYENTGQKEEEVMKRA